MFRFNKHLKLLFTAIVVTALLPVKVHAQQLKEKEIPTTAGAELENNCVYKVTKNTTITNTSAGGNGLAVKENSNVVIYIAKDVTLKVEGGNGSYSIGGGAGIYLPSTSTLVVCGDGTLEAVGGGIGAGSSGGKAGSGELSISDVNGKGGRGGKGGAGGGGAGAAIGGYGGSGGASADPPYGTQKKCELKVFSCSGNNGGSTQNGSAGAGMGSLYVVGHVTVKASVAKGQLWSGSGGSTDGVRNASDYGSGWENYYMSGPGGPGGGGGSGYYPYYAIGCGGYGGQSGACGGAGGTYAHPSKWIQLDGGPGSGGYGHINGYGTSGWSRSSQGDYGGGYGGFRSSSNRTDGDQGTVYKHNSTKIDQGTDSFQDITERNDAKETKGETPTFISIVFDFRTEGDKGPRKVFAYGCSYYNVGVPEHSQANMAFEGYYTAEKGGTKMFDREGNPTFATCYETDHVTLYAHWITDTWMIDSAKKFKEYLEALNNNHRYINGVLTCDIDAKNEKWDMQMTGESYMGTFDGGYHTISNLYIYNSNWNIGIFPTVGSDGVIKNVIFNNVKLTHRDSYTIGAAIVGNNSGTIERCGVTGTFTFGKVAGKYGIAGNHTGKMIDCFTQTPALWGTGGGTSTNCYNNYNDAAVENMKSGKVCYLLNHNGHLPFRQTLGKDNAPTFYKDHDKVGYDKDAKEEHKYYNLSYLLVPDSVYVCTDFYPTQNTSVLAHYGFGPLDSESFAPTLFGATDTGDATFKFELDKNGETFTAKGVYGKDEKGNEKAIAIENKFDTYAEYDRYFGMSRQEVFIDNSVVAPEHDFYNRIDKKFESGTSKEPIYIGSTDLTELTTPFYVHEFNVMDGGVLMHRFLPSKFNGGKGLYDVVKNTFCPVNKLDGVEVHIPYCDHRYSVVEYIDNVAYQHCVICDELDSESNYRLIHYIANAPQGTKADGMMGDELIVAPAGTELYEPELRQNVYSVPLYLFDGWTTNPDGTGDKYDNRAKIQITDTSRGSLSLYAKWSPGYTYSADTTRIPADGIVTDAIVIKDTPNNRYGLATAAPVKFKNLTYTRTLSKGSNWGSLCLPFELTSNADVQYYLTADVDGDQITLHPTDKVSAGVPCVFLLLKETEELKLTAPGEVMFDGKVQDGSKGGNVTLYGTYVYQDFKCEEQGLPYYAIQDGTFYNVKSAMVVRPFRAYMRMQNIEHKVRERLYITNEEGTEVTAVEAFDPEEVKVIGMFDIGGSPQNRLGKGLNIIRFSDGTTKKIYLK